MKLFNSNLVFGIIFLGVSFFIINCGGDDSITNNNLSASKIVSGNWIADTEFGRIEFIVGDSGMDYNWISCSINNYQCGDSIVNSGLVYMDNVDEGWSIIDRSFTQQLDIRRLDWDSGVVSVFATDTLRIECSFGDDGKSAMGTWDYNGTCSCSGTWEGSPE